METWRTTLSVFCQKLLLAALNNLQITRGRWTSVSCFPWWHLDPGQHLSSRTWYRKSTKCTFFLCWLWSELWASEFFVQNSWKLCFPWALLGPFPSWAVSKSCFYFRVETRPSETSSGAGVFSCQGQREEKFPICVFVLMLSEKVSGAVTKYL